MAFINLGMVTGGSDLKQRLSKALLDVSGTLASVKSGALVQVWMPEHTHDGTIVLSCQGLPFAVAGVGDLLALFRCVSVRYRFSTDVMKPSLMGAIGRVYSTLEPEMSHNVQKYDKQVYLRVSEAQRCRVHSTLMVPIFGSESRDAPLAVFELVQGDRDVTFPAVLSQLTSALQSVRLYTTDLDMAASAAGLRKWPLHIDMVPAADYAVVGASRLSPTSEEPRRVNSMARLMDVADEREPAAASSNIVATEEKHSPAASRGDEAGSWAGDRTSQGPLARLQAGPDLQQSNNQQAGTSQPQLSSSPQLGLPSSAAAGLPAVTPAALSAGITGVGAGLGSSGAFGIPFNVEAAVGTREMGADGQSASRSSSGPTLDPNNAQQLISLLSQHSGGSTAALGQLRALLEQQQQQQQQQQLQQGGTEQPGGAGASSLLGSQLEAVQQQQQQPSQPQPPDAQPATACLGSSPPGKASASPPKNGLLLPQQQQQQQPAADSGVPATAAFAAAVGTSLVEKQGTYKLARSSSVPRSTAGAGTAAEADDGECEDISSGGEDDESDDDRPGSNRNNNRVGGGAGKRLRFEDLQAQFGLGLKEAANNLGICATTLKRACRRHGIKRWPRRQIAKLSKALNQMGYSGAPPPGIVQNAVASTQAAAAKPKPVKKPDPVVLQQATQLLFHQQLGAAAAGAGGGSGGLFPAAAASMMLSGGQMQPQNLHGLFAVAGHGQPAAAAAAAAAAAVAHQQAQQPQGMFPGSAFIGGMGPLMAHQHGGNPPGAALGPGHPVLLGGMGTMSGGLSAAMQMPGMGGLGGMQGAGLGAMQGAGLGAMQAAALGLQVQGAGAMQRHGSAAAQAMQMQMQGGPAVLHPLLAAGGFGMHHQIMEQQHMHMQAQAQQQQQLQAQQQQHHQHQGLVQQQQQQQAAQQQQQQHQQAVQQQQATAAGPSLHPLPGADPAHWLGQAQGSSALGTLAAAQLVPLGGLGAPVTGPMDVGAPRVSCGDTASPFSGLGMSPGMSGGLSEIPEEFIHNLNSTAGGSSHMSQVLKSGALGCGMELMDLLGDDLAAR